jgi:hypothetical protein
MDRAATPLCWECCLPLTEGVDLPFVLHMGQPRVFCSESCRQHWLDDSQEGAAFKELLA